MTSEKADFAVTGAFGVSSSGAKKSGLDVKSTQAGQPPNQAIIYVVCCCMQERQDVSQKT
jgi:hypothetical protein